MQLKLNLFAAAIAISLPAAAAAQMSGQGYGQPSSTGQAAQEPQSSTGLTRQAGDAQADTGQVKQATSADIKAGAEVYDPKGGAVGKVESVAADGVVVSTGSVKAKIPAKAIGKGDKGLVIAMTKSEFEAAAKKAPSS
jgi:preprotein translocase subunit YajC